MSTDEIIRAWKSEDDEGQGEGSPANPAGEELSDEDLEEIEGGINQPESPYCASPNCAALISVTAPC